MTVLIGMFLLGLFIALGSWVISWTDHVKKDLVVNVYFCTDLTCGEEASPKQIDALRADLAANPDVKEFSFISKERALEIMKDRYPEITENLARNPLPPAYEVIPVDGDRVQEVAASLEPAPAGVEKVTYGERSEEHTSELQSPCNLVCRLLLEK